MDAPTPAVSQPMVPSDPGLDALLPGGAGAGPSARFSEAPPARESSGGAQVHPLATARAAVGRYAASGPEAQRRTDSALIIRHRGLLMRCARMLALRTGCVSLIDDFWSVGAMALVEAAHRFDPARETSFASFVEHRVRGAMLDELRRMDHLPRRLRVQSERVVREKALLSRELGREVSSDELAERLGMTLADVSGLELLAQPLVPIDAILLDRIPAEMTGMETRADEWTLRQRLVESIQSLTPRLRQVLALHYVESLTYKEIAGLLQVTEPRICQIHGEAVGKIRAFLEQALKSDREQAAGVTPPSAA